jgi:hypothetical protein
MITSHPTDAQASASSAPFNVKAATAGACTPVMNPRKPIEVASDGSGTVNDPSAKDKKPPCV